MFDIETGLLNMDEVRAANTGVVQGELARLDYQTALRIQEADNRFFESQIWFQEAYDELGVLVEEFEAAEAELERARKAIRQIR